MNERKQIECLETARKVERLRDEAASIKSILRRLPSRQRRAKALRYDFISLDIYFRREKDRHSGSEHVSATNLTPALVDAIEPILRDRLKEIETELEAMP